MSSKSVKIKIERRDQNVKSVIFKKSTNFKTIK